MSDRELLRTELDKLASRAVQDGNFKVAAARYRYAKLSNKEEKVSIASEGKIKCDYCQKLFVYLYTQVAYGSVIKHICSGCLNKHPY